MGVGMVVEFRVLGALEVIRDGVGRSVPSRRQRALVARLLLGRGQVVPTDALVDAVWEDAPPRDARHAVHTLVSRVRALLGPVVETRAPGYRLAVPAGAVDAERFETGLAAAVDLAAEDPVAAVACGDELLGLWRGPAYAEFAGSFAQAAAVRLEELRLTAREERAEALLAAGALDRAVGELGELVAEQPLRERPHGQLMRALHRAGRQPDALAVYHGFRERVRGELGLDPSPALRQVHEQVLRQPVPVPVPAATPAAPPVTSFVGRDAELRRLAELAGGGGRRIVTLVGPGGVGKTRLARELLARLPSDRTGWWVDLVPVREPADLPYRFLDALGLPEPAEGDIERFLVDELGGGGAPQRGAGGGLLRAAHALLVVDNCEHVIAPAALMLARIAAGCPGVVVLATSRERLAVDGEQVVTLGPLPEPGSGSELGPAVALFADRYRAAGRPDLSTEDVALAAEVCQRVDRLPLAIELAAARAASLGVAAVAARPALELLTGGRRTDQPRHRSLRAVLDWSHDLLSSAERVLFRRLAGFRGAFTLDDAEAVCADGTLARAQVAEALAGLVDKSMVAGPDRADRCRLLEAMRAYAGEQLAGHGEDRWLGAAHARHFVRFAEQARDGLLTPQEREWAARLAGRVDELRAAHRWACAHAASERSSEASDAVGVAADLALRLAVALADYASYRARFELQEWAETAAALPAAADHPLRARALGSAAAGAWARGDFARAEKLARRGLAAAPAGDPRAAGPMLVLGDLALAEGRFGDAVAAYREVATFGETVPPYLACEALGGLAIAASYQGEPAEAVRLTDAARVAADRRGAPGLVAMSRYFAGEARLASDPAAALALLGEARALAAGVGAWFVVGIATLSEVSLRGRTGTDPAEALAAYREAIEHWRRVGNRTQQWVTLRNLVPLLVRAGHDELACVLDGALASAPVRLPADVPVPEAEALSAAVARACARLGDQAAGAARERGARAGFDELVAAVLTAMDDRQAGSSR